MMMTLDFLRCVLLLTGIDPKIILFAMADATGGMYAFWKYPGRFCVMRLGSNVCRSDENAPIIFMGSEGQAKIMASSVSQFIALQGMTSVTR